MPSVDELTSLFLAISTKDWTAVDQAARSIAACQDDRGHHAAARTLRGALAATNGTARRRDGNGNSATQFGPANALLRLDQNVELDDVRLRSKAKNELERFVREWKHRDQLQAKGLETRRRLLFHGPPGCGKSMAASALGTALEMPVFVLRFDSIITSYLGQTAANLRHLFQFVEQQSCVLLIDELDALGRRRGERMDVGELDRIVISLMQELEHSHPAGIVIATCNLPDDLDRAIWRRFDVEIEFPLPTKNELAGFIRQKAAAFGIRLTQSVKQKVARRISYADSEKIIESEARNVALRGL